MNRYILYTILAFIFLSACSSTSKFNSGSEAFERKHYFTATQMLKKELESSNNKTSISKKSFLLGESYRLMDNPERSIEWFKKSIKYGADRNVYFRLVDQLKKLEKYDDGILVLQELKKKTGNSAALQRELSICRQAKKWHSNPDSSIIIRPLDINSEYSEFASDYYLNDYFVFSSDRYNSSRTKYAWTGSYFYNLFIVDKEGIGQVKPFSRVINKKNNDASACFNKSGTEMYFVRCGEEGVDNQFCKLYISTRIGGDWSQVKVLPFIKEGVNYISPFLSEDDKILFFSSDDDSGYGNFDIYFSIKSGDNWSVPKLLPNYINTPGNEKFITTWNNNIYFSSDYLPGLGGYDIYKTSIDSTGSFTPPIHFDYPLNSGGDDFSLLKKNDVSGIFSSSRKGGVGQDDIYSFNIVQLKSKVVKDSIDIEKESEKKEIEKKIYLALKVVENVYLDAKDPNSQILGKKAIQGVTLFIGNDKKYITPSNGLVLEKINFDTSFQIIAGKSDYLSSSIDINVKKESDYIQDITTINKKIILEKIYLGQEIILNDIFYDFDKWNLRSDAEPTLNKLYNILKNNKRFKVKIGSHTDCRGEKEYNQVLSQNRAQSVVDYLVNKGINSKRLFAEGYGKSKLIEECKCEECTELQHQKNRRTTFELLK